MEKLVILDHYAQNIKIHIYNVDSNLDLGCDYIEALGFDPDQCLWFFGTSVDILKHKGVLK